MIKHCLLLIASVTLFAAAGYSQTFPGGATTIAAYTVATLPGSSSSGTLAVVTDASTAGSCTVGSGTALSLCRWSGAAWITVGGSGGTGTVINTYTVSTLPGSPATATIAFVTDASPAGSCTVGGGTGHSVCQYTGSAWAPIGAVIDASAITSGLVLETHGGTGANNSPGSAGHVLRSNGTHYVDSAIQAADVPTLNQNTTGNAANVTGIVAEPNGGTGANNTPGSAGHVLRSNGTHYVDSAIQTGDVPTLNQSTTGNAGTATALGANGSNCGSNQFAQGVDASGNAEGCAQPPIATSATQLNGGAVPTSAHILGSNGTNQPVAATAVDLAAIKFATSSGGTANAQTATFTPAIGSLTDGLEACWTPQAANTTTTPTLAVSGLTAETIVKAGGALAASDLTTTRLACAIYNTTGTEWELENPQTSTGGGFSNPMNAVDQIIGSTSSSLGVASPITLPSCSGPGNALQYNTTTHTAPCTTITGSFPDPGANGITARTALNTLVARIFTSGDNTISITNPDGVGGAPSFVINSAFAPTNATLLACGVLCASATGSSSGNLIASSALLSYTNNSFLQLMIVDGPSHGGDNLNLNAIGPIALFKMVGTTATAIAAGDLRQNVPYQIRYTTCGIGCVAGSGGSPGYLVNPDGLTAAGVTSFSGDGNFANNSSSSGPVTLSLVTAAAHKFWGNNTGSTAAPGYQTIGLSDLPGSGSITIDGVTCTLAGSCSPSTGGGGSSLQVGPQLVAPPPGLNLPVLQQFPGQTQALGGAFSGAINGTFNGVFYVTGNAPYQTLTSTYNAAKAMGWTNPIIHADEFALTPEVMYCTPWVNDGTESVFPAIYLGSGILQFSNHKANGQACAANQSTFGPANHVSIHGVNGGYASSATSGTIIQAYAGSSSAGYADAWSSVPATNYGLGNQYGVMPLVVIGDYTNSVYDSYSVLTDVAIDCNNLPGCLGWQMREAQEGSGLFNVQVKGAVMVGLWNSSGAQNSQISTIYDAGCFTSSVGTCLIDSGTSTTNGSTPRLSIENVPSMGGITGENTYNGGNNANGWAVTSTTQTGSAPVTVTLTSTMQVGQSTAPGTITVHGTAGSSTCTYELVALQSFTKPAQGSSTTTTSTCNATLSSTNYLSFATTTLTGTHVAKVYRTAGGASQGYIGQVVLGQTYFDYGQGASATDVTPNASTTQTGLVVGDAFCWSGGSNSINGCWPVASVSSGTSFTFAPGVALTPCGSSCGSMAVMPKSLLNICAGASCTFDASGNPTHITILGTNHFEHGLYGLNVDSNSSTNLALSYGSLDTPPSATNTDLSVLVNIPNVAIQALQRGLTKGTATVSLYQDLNAGVTLASSVHSDDGGGYGFNGTSIPYNATLGVAASTVSYSFSATPTFTCPSSTNGVVTTFKLGQLTGNVTSSTLASCTSAQLIVYIFQQAASGGPYTVAMPTGFDPAPLSQTANIYTTLVYDWDGTNGRLLNSTNDTQTTIYMTERSVSSLATPSSGTAVCGPDSTDHAGLECKANNSANIFQMIPRSGTTTTQPLFQTATAGQPAYRAIAAGDLPAALGTSTTAHNVAAPLLCADSSGSPTAQSCTTSPSFTPATGDTLIYTTTTANTGALTIAVNGGSAAGVDKWAGSTALASGDMPANKPIKMTFDAAGHWDVDDIGNAPSGSGNVNNSGTPTNGQVAQWISSTGIKGIDFPDVKDYPSANCVSSTAGSAWDTTLTAACVGGSNNVGGWLPFADASVAQFKVHLPLDWDTTQEPYINLEFDTATNTTGTMIFQVQTGCYKLDGSTTDNPTFATAQVLTTATAAAANRVFSENVQLNAVTSGNSCVPNGTMIVKITRNTDTAASVVGVTAAHITTPRLLTVQAN